MATAASTREGKSALIGEVKGKFDKATSVVLLDYKGLNVETVTKLRASFRKAGVEYKVVKNTLVKHALKESAYSGKLNELRERRLERCEELGAELVFTGHVRELVLDRFRVEDRTLHETRLDLELLAGRAFLAESLHHLGGGSGFFVAPSNAGHADERGLQLVEDR